MSDVCMGQKPLKSLAKSSSTDDVVIAFVARQETEAANEPAAEDNMSGGDGLENLTTAHTSLDSADVGFGIKLLPEQPPKHQYLRRRQQQQQQRQHLLEDTSLAGIVQRLKDQQSTQSLPAFAHLKSPQMRKSL